jgi:exoribonuclease R
VHRELLRSLETDQELMPNNELQDIVEHINQHHRASKAVQLESMEWFAAMYFKNHQVAEEGVIYSMRANAFQVFIPAYHIKGTLWVVNKEGKVIIPEGEASRLQLTEQHLENAQKLFDEDKLEMVY